MSIIAGIVAVAGIAWLAHVGLYHDKDGCQAHRRNRWRY